MLDFTCCDSLVANVPGTRKESGKPGSRAGARSLQQPYFLGAQCTSCPEGFLCNRSTFLLQKKNCLSPTESSSSSRSKTVTLLSSYNFGIPMPEIIHARHPFVLLTWTIITSIMEKVNRFSVFHQKRAGLEESLSQFFLQCMQKRLCHTYMFS